MQVEEKPTQTNAPEPESSGFNALGSEIGSFFADEFDKLNKVESSPEAAKKEAAPEPQANTKEKQPETKTKEKQPAAKSSEPAPPVDSEDEFGFGSVLDTFNQDEAAPGQQNQDAPAQPEEKSDEEVDAEIDSRFPDTPPEGAKATARANERWAELKRELKRVTREFRNLKSASDRPITENPDYIALKNQLEEAQGILQAQERELYVSRIEATREFKEVVTEPKERIQKVIEGIAGRAGISPSEILAAFNEVDESRREEMMTDLTASMNDRDRIRLYQMEGEYADVQRAEKVLRENAREAMDRLTKDRERREQEEQMALAQERAEAIDRVWEVIQKNTPLFRPRKDNAQWNAQLDKLRDFTRNLDFDSLDAQRRAEIAHYAGMAPILYELLKVQGRQNIKLRKEIESLRAAEPGAGAGSADDAAPSTQSEITEETTFEEAIQRNLR